MAPEFHQAVTLEHLLRYVERKLLGQASLLRQRVNRCGSD
jgi:hypothetical protein